MTKRNKTWAVLVAAILLVAIAIPTVAAVTNALKPEQKSELTKLYNQMLDTQKQIIQKRVEYGQVDKTRGQFMMDQLELRRKYIDQWVENGGMGFGPGRRGGRGGMMGNGGPGPGQCPNFNQQQQNP